MYKNYLTLHCILFVGGDNKSDVGVALRSQLNGTSLGDVLEQLRRCPVGLESDLNKAISFGVAFHHAGNSFFLFII